MKDLYERMKPFISEAISVTHERFSKFSSISSDFIHSNKIVVAFDVCCERDVRFITAINFMEESSEYYWHEEGCWGYAKGCSLAIGEDYANPVDGFILSKEEFDHLCKTVFPENHDLAKHIISVYDVMKL